MFYFFTIKMQNMIYIYGRHKGESAAYSYLQGSSFI